MAGSGRAGLTDYGVCTAYFWLMRGFSFLFLFSFLYFASLLASGDMLIFLGKQDSHECGVSRKWPPNF